MKPDQPKVEYLHPKFVMRQWMDLIQDLPGRYRPIVTALWNYSDDFFTKEQLLDEDSSFSTSRTSYRQISLFTGGQTQLKKKLKEMYELGYLDYDPDEHHPHGTIYTVYAKARHLPPHMIQSARRVKRAIKDMQAKFEDPEYLKDAEESEPDEVEEGTMVDPWAGEEEYLESGGRAADLNKEGQAVSLEGQAVSDFRSGGFENQVRRFSPEGQADGVTSGFKALASNQSGQELSGDHLANPSPKQSPSESKAEHNQCVVDKNPNGRRSPQTQPALQKQSSFTAYT